MAETWYGGDAPDPTPLGLMDWCRVVARAVPLGVLVFGGLIILLAVRLFERPLCGVRRPVTPHITQVVCRLAFIVLGIRYSVTGRPMQGPGAVVANHASWLDIFALNARKRVYFVSKSEVAGWPGIGWLARATGTVFIRRDRREAATQISIFRERLAAGHKLLFFPEGTSTDGQQVLPFKPTLFAAFFDDALRDTLQIQPVTVNYTAPPGADPRFYGWWGDMDFGPHLLSTLAAPRQGKVSVTYHAPVKVSDFEDRKTLAKATEEAVRDGLASAPV
ncbi:lysophospholipid acyltransferase family protein [Cognatiyoonia sp. IB215182]|uniref:lysophospholipid acyltransferase family protein n=1 Tax=Cognatiyoonia sp. IB215182 TaxID=3097353 RepID=UPI002A15E455|nr:lysophospholipid acyltransferase family protein [Cognatiyoonia sp. IB215182]MDX8353568.1 lysophospholipid acyltransferase family protein [Cognatiyoonia sp. IB215182]